MKTFVVICPLHGEYEVTPLEGGECPKWCVISENNITCGLELKRVYEATPVHYRADGFTKRVSK